MANGVDPSAKSPARVRRNWNRAIKGSVTASLGTTLPITLDSQNKLKVNVLSTGGLDSSATSLQLKLPSTSGLQTSSSGVSVKPNAAGAITVDASGVAVATDGVTIEISGNKIQIKAGSISGAKFGWATTKGDLLVFNGTSYVRLPVGSDGQVLTADSASSAGVKWA